jgi:hypothetical protein
MNFGVYYMIFIGICMIYEVPNMWHIDLGIFHKVPIILIFNSGRNFFLLVLLTFQETRNLKKGKVNAHVSKFSRRIQRAKVGHQNTKRAPRRSHGMA